MEAEHFDIAILDVMGVDGYILVEMAIEKKVIAVMLTAHGLCVEGAVKSFEKAVASYVSKEKMKNITTC